MRIYGLAQDIYLFVDIFEQTIKQTYPESHRRSSSFQVLTFSSK